MKTIGEAVTSYAPFFVSLAIVGTIYVITLQCIQSIVSRKIYLVFLSYRKKVSPKF